MKNPIFNTESFSLWFDLFELQLKIFSFQYDVDDYTFTKKFDPNPYGADYYGYDEYTLSNLGQYCINMAFLTYTNKTKFSPITLNRTSFVEIPSPLYKNDGLGDSLQVWTVIIPLIILIPAIFSVKEVAKEKENGVHTYMIVMGMDRYMYYLSHFIFATLKMWMFVIPAGLVIAVTVPVSFTFLNFKVNTQFRVAGGSILI